jgi:hypothetical protein
MKKVYVNSKQQVSITCEACGKTYTRKVPLHIRGNTLVKARCQCGNDLEVAFEFRQAYRKSTNLPGKLQKPGNKASQQAAEVKNLSQSGIRFATCQWHNIHQNDILKVNFILDNSQSSQVNKQVIVKYVNQQGIGAEFCPEDQLSYQKEIGFYLIS